MLWLDPLADAAPGILAADELAYYCHELGLVRPFRASAARSASYTVHLGPQYWRDGKLYDLTGEGIGIEPGDTVVVAPAEVLIVPHYLVGHFGPSVDTVHRGLGFGTALQVDPGYQGALSCPLHNYGARPTVLPEDAPFGRLDFMRLRFAAGSSGGFSSEDELYAAAESGRLRGAGGHPQILFRRRNRWRDPFGDSQYLPQR